MKRLTLVGLLLFVALPLVAQAQTDASIVIVKPGDRRNVELGEITVTIAVAGAQPGAVYSWQMLIDGVPQGVVQGGTQTNVIMPKPTGPHRLKAELYDASGKTISAHEILVMAAPVENRDFVFNRSWYVPAMAVFTLVIVAIIFLGLRLRPRAAT